MRIALAVAALAVAACGPARAATVTVNAGSSGTIYSSPAGVGKDASTYLAGFGPGPTTNVNYFVFDLPGLPGRQILGASLTLDTFTVLADPLASVSFALRDLSQGSVDAPSLASLTDVGTGALYGSRQYTEGDANQLVTIDLTPAFVADANAARGGRIAFGGSVDPASAAQYGVFFNSTSFAVPKLTLQVSDPPAATPLPAALPAGLSLFGGLGLLGRHRRRPA